LPMRAFVVTIVRGLATLLPPLLTMIILVWAWRKLDEYAISPLHRASVTLIVDSIADIRDPETPAPETGTNGKDGYLPTKDGSLVPAEVIGYLNARLDPSDIARSGRGVYRQYVELRYLPRHWFVPVVFCSFLGVLYIAGLFGNRNLGMMVRNRIRKTVDRVPIVRQVYAVVIQVTQHVLAKPPSSASRVVAVEFPRKNVWAIGYVVKEGLAEVAGQAQEPVLTVFMDTSPIPMSGYTVMFKQSETIPLNISIEEAFRFVISCGIIVPPQQRVVDAADNPV
jgi:uncharacterized membrane protein